MPSDQPDNEATKDLGSSSLANNPFIRGSEYKVTVDTNAEVTIQLSSTPSGVIVLNAPFAVSARIVSYRNKRATIRFTAPYELVDTKSINKSTTSFNFSSNALDRTATYKLEAYWKRGTNATWLLWRVNGASSASLTNAHSKYSQLGSSTAPTTSGFVLGVGDTTTAGEHSIVAEFPLDNSENRVLRSLDNITSGTGASTTQLRNITSKWEDSASVTSLGVQSAVADKILSGSTFELFRKSKFNKTKITLWVH